MEVFSWDSANIYTGISYWGQNMIFLENVDLKVNPALKVLSFAVAFASNFISITLKAAAESLLTVSAMSMTSHLRFLEQKAERMMVHEVRTYFELFKLAFLIQIYL